MQASNLHVAQRVHRSFVVRHTLHKFTRRYALYTNNAADYANFPLGNRLGLTQLDADQFADVSAF